MRSDRRKERPRDVRFVDGVPRTPTGKVIRRVLDATSQGLQRVARLRRGVLLLLLRLRSRRGFQKLRGVFWLLLPGRRSLAPGRGSAVPARWHGRARVCPPSGWRLDAWCGRGGLFAGRRHSSTARQRDHRMRYRTPSTAVGERP